MTTIKTKADATNYLYACGDSRASFLCNVVQTGHRNAGARLRRLAKLHLAGLSVRCAPYAMDILIVGGSKLDWADLDRLDPKDPAGSLQALRS